MLEITKPLVEEICANLGVPQKAADIMMERLFPPGIGTSGWQGIAHRDQVVAVVVKYLSAPLWR